MSRAAAQTPLSPLSSTSLQALQRLSDSLSSAELMWASGYLAGHAYSGDPIATPGDTPATTTTVIFATETGNSRRVAESLVGELIASGSSAAAVDARDIKISRLKKESRVVIVAATHGLGDAPEGSEDFFDALASSRAPNLEHLEFAVLGLGDSSYDDFCQIGIAVDARLEQLGAKRMLPRVDCDLDFAATARSWTGELLAHIAADSAKTSASAAATRAAPYLRPVPDQEAARGPKNPFLATVLTNQRITGRDSSKSVHHIELDIEDAGLSYEPGDSLGVITENPPQIVHALLETVSASGEETVQVAGDAIPLEQALRERLDITASHRNFVEHYARVTDHGELGALLETPGSIGRDFFYRHQILDVLNKYPAPLAPQQLVDGLRARAPRLYSIASSPDANPDEAHLTVARVRYDAFGQTRLGSASTSLAAGLDVVPVYVEPNPHFRLPADSATPIVMIGAGTGVAPYRAFLEHRAEQGAQGKNWLFFGDRTLRHDFLYQLELRRHLREGTLANLDVAFSRDQHDKVYVQHRLRERGKALFSWIADGAHLYVCGDATNMAPDVHEALRDIVAREGDMNPESAEAYLRQMKRDNRYQRDVY